MWTENYGGSKKFEQEIMKGIKNVDRKSWRKLRMWTGNNEGSKECRQETIKGVKTVGRK